MGKDSKAKSEKSSHKKSKNLKKKNEEVVKVEKKVDAKEKKSKKESQNGGDSKKPKKVVKEVAEEEETLQEVQKKPGQKHAEPSLDDPTRAFYETLYEQNPKSAMAQKYCLEYGLLPEDVATSLLGKLKNKR